MLDALLESLSNSILMVNHPVRRNGNLRASHPDELIDRGKLEEGVNACPFDLNRINAYSSPLSIEKYGGVSWIDQVIRPLLKKFRTLKTFKNVHLLIHV